MSEVAVVVVVLLTVVVVAAELLPQAAKLNAPNRTSTVIRQNDRPPIRGGLLLACTFGRRSNVIDRHPREDLPRVDPAATRGASP
jgi:hypothetical protein